MGFNWNKLKLSQEGKGMPVYYPDKNGEPTGAVINLLSADCKQARDWLVKQNRNRNFNLNDREHQRQFLVFLTVGWSGLDDADGTELEFNTDNASRLYTECPEIEAQAVEFCLKKENYYDPD